MDRVECAVVGAGAVGLAIARALAQAGREVLVLESETAIGTATSSRNSEVIHAGIYYPAGSLKARLCVAGKEKLYDYCQRKGVGHKRLGKIIVATTEDELPMLDDYLRRAEGNGVMDLELISAQQVNELEPDVVAAGGVLSPSTGIIDSHEYMLSLQGDLELAGGQVALASPVSGGRVDNGGFVLQALEHQVEIGCDLLVNSAGLQAQTLSAVLEGLPPASIPPCHYAKGHYFTLTGSAPFQRLVYPLATNAGLGVHVTLDMAGAARFGPDVAWVDDIDYDFDESRHEAFVSAIRAYYPQIKPDHLVPGYTGIRPKVVGPGDPAADFIIQGPEDHGVGGFVALYGIESPGLTASLAIGDYVRELLCP